MFLVNGYVLWVVCQCVTLESVTAYVGSVTVPLGRQNRSTRALLCVTTCRSGTRGCLSVTVVSRYVPT